MTGCFATTNDTEALRSDMSVLEKQFLQMQRDVTRLKYEGGEVPEAEAAEGGVPAETGEFPAAVGEVPAATGGVPADTDTVARISNLEERVASLESQVRYLQQSGPPAEATPVEPEQVGMPDEAPPPIVVEPAVKPPSGSAPKRTVEEMYSEAVKQYRSGELDKAEKVLADLLEQYPDDNKYADNAQYYLGNIYFQRENYHRAIEEFDKVVTNYPVGDKVPDAIYMMGLSYKKLGLEDRARTNFNRVMDNYPYSDAALKARQALEQAE